LIDVRNIVGPTIGIRGTTVCKEDESFLFLRREEWALAWDTMIASCYRDRNKPTFEKDYEVKIRDEDDDDESDEEYEDDEEDVESDEDDDDDDTDDGADIVVGSHGRREKQHR
jgi:hypothetical protein